MTATTPTLGKDRAVRLQLSRADELTASPILGQTYLVPTVRHDWRGLVSDWPIMGPKHDDHDLRFPWKHYHLDARFVTASQARKMEREYSLERWQFRNASSLTDAVALAAASSPLQENAHLPKMPEPIWRRRVCRRVNHDYPLVYSLKNDPHAKMHETYAGRPCGKNAEGLLICPHKGFVLNSLSPDEHGRVVCPLHGLVIDVRAEAVVPSSPAPVGAGRSS